MINHRLTMLQIKSDLMDLWTEETASQSYEQWFEALKPNMLRHFGIEEADFFIYANECFVPLKGHRSAQRRRDAIRFSTLDTEEIMIQDSFISKFRDRGFEYADDYLLFRNWKSEILGLLILKSTDRWKSFGATPLLDELERTVSHLIQTVRKMVFLVKEEKSFRQLFSVTELFNSTMESNVILDGIVEAVNESFPTFQVDLLLSHDQNERKHTYKLFDYMNERPSAINAFVSGEVTMEESPEQHCKLVNAPIKGRQGIYGVLQINAPIDFVFSSSQKNFIRMVANTAGNALENASLYDQSHRVIEDLQLVNETSRKLNSNMHFDEMISYLKQQLLRAFHPEEVAFIFYNEGGSCDISPLSTEFFESSSGQKYIAFASAYIKSGKEAMFDASFSSTMNEPILYESIIAIPIMNQEKVAGFVLLLHSNQYYFSFDSFKLMQSLISHSSLALANSMLRDQLQELVDKDHLTKLYTRTYLDKVIENSIANDESGVFLLLDVDNFKHVNDTYGHSIGDEVLKQISSSILTEVAEKGVAARWGGEEIAVYLPSVKFDEGIKFARHLIQHIPTETEPRVTVSGGMCSWTSENPMTFIELFQSTDKALYRAKNNGKNQIIIHDTSKLHP